MHNDLTPTERLAIAIADLKAQLELAGERMFFVAAQNSALRAALTDLSNDCIDKNNTISSAFNNAKKLLDQPPYSVK